MPKAFYATDFDRGGQNVAYFDVSRYNHEIERIEELTRAAARSAAWATLDAQMMRDDPPWAPVMVSAENDYVSQSYGCYLFQPAIAEPEPPVIAPPEDGAAPVAVGAERAGSDSGHGPGS